MYNWSTDTKKLRQSPKQYLIWKLESLINFGLNGEKLNKAELRKNLPKLKIDSQKRKSLNFLLNSK